MLKFGKIYKIVNDINSKVYVGQTIQKLEKQFNGHCCYSKTDRSCNMYIKRAIHKYGKKHFRIELIEECPIEQLDDREQYWIAYYDSYNNGYNLTLGGQKSNNFSPNRLENSIDLMKFENYITEFTPSATEVANHFGICKCSVYNLIDRLNNPNLKLKHFTPRVGKPIDEKIVFEKYNNGWSVQDIAKLCKVSKKRISKVLHNLGIKPRRGIKGYKHRI